MKSAISLVIMALGCGVACTPAQASVIYQSSAGVNVNGQFTPDLTATATASFTISATINPTQGGGGGVVIDEVDSPYGNQSWYDSQIEVEADGTVLASTWGHNGGYVGALNLGKANFGADNTVSFDYNDATGLFSANLNGTLSSMNYGAGARYTPVAYGSSQFYGFGNGDITNLGNGQSFVGTIADVTIGSGAAAVPEPAIWAMMLVGMGLIGFAARRRQNVSLTYA